VSVSRLTTIKATGGNAYDGREVQITDNLHLIEHVATARPQIDGDPT
jgi:hypothetical protein